jgi:integrase
MNNHVLPILGKKKIYTLHQKDIEDFIHQEILICDERSKRQQEIYQKAEEQGVKPSLPTQSAPFYKSIKKHVNVLSQMLKYAVTVDDIPYNVADKIDKSIFRKLVGERFRGNTYTPDEVKKLQESVIGTEIEVPVMLALTLALRRSEVAGLRWSAIDFDNSVVHINHTCIIQDNQPKYVDLTKNASSHADMYLSASIKEYLQSVKKKQENDKKFYGKGYQDSDYVCRHSDGSLIKPNYISQNFPKFLEKNNLKRIRFHDLRHISGSIVLNSTGDLKLTSEYLRHSSIQVTGDIYSHVDMNRKKAAADILAATVINHSE